MSYDPQVTEALRAERQAPGMPAEMKQHLHQSLSALTKAASIAADLGPEAASTGAVGLFSSQGLLVLSTVALLGGAAGFYVGQRDVRVLENDLAGPNVLEVAPRPRPAQWDVFRYQPTTPAPQSKASVAPERASNEEADRALRRERQRLMQARSALLAGDPQEALRAVRVHRREHPEGRLSEERDLLEIRALTRAEAFLEAQRKATQFLKTYPESVFRSTVEELRP